MVLQMMEMKKWKYVWNFETLFILLKKGAFKVKCWRNYEKKKMQNVFLYICSRGESNKIVNMCIDREL